MNPSKTDRYQLAENGECTINDYNSTKLFSSFFPGIAGKHGIPMWTFYVNRGQCICSMGIDGKHHPIMEFLPANWAYNLVSSQGFRTFIKLPEHPTTRFYEPFQNQKSPDDFQLSQKMIIAPAKLTLEEVNHTLGLVITVEYFNAPQESYAGLIRKLTITNTNPKPLSLEVLDGLPLIIPYGLDNFGLKNMRRLFEAFVEVTNFQNKVPFYKLKVEPADRPDVVRIKKGNFYLGYGPDSELVTPIYDPVKIFGNRGDYAYPERFLSSSPEELAAGQIFENRLPSAMGSFQLSLAPNSTYIYNSVIGHAGSEQEINDLVPKITLEGYVATKDMENRSLVAAITQKNFICSSEPVLNQYTRQNFLDNVLRGGFPYTIKGKTHSTTLHLYSRKHGDLERDYNDYRLTPTPYSQGNGNFRDVNQNRRSDLFFNPDVEDANVIQFYNLIQLDGFNPLVIKEIRYSISDPGKWLEIAAEYLAAEHVEPVTNYLRDTFTPGELMIWLSEQHITVNGDTDVFIGDVLYYSNKHYGTEHAEGYWSDHWTYNLDLLENYLAIYPELKKQIIFDKQVFSFYDNAHYVQPRDEKYVIWDGKAMQLKAVAYDAEKDRLIQSRAQHRNKVRTDHGKGGIYTTCLFIKLMSLVVNKLASLDAEGVGVEMETDKPNWYDALNGLPGLMGSSISETLEIKRHILFILDVLNDLDTDVYEISIYTELMEFIRKLHRLLADSLSPIEYWDRATTAKEHYREVTKYGIDGREEKIDVKGLVYFLSLGLKKLDEGIAKAWNKTDNVISTYFINEVLEYDLIIYHDQDGKETQKYNAKGLPCFRARKFRQLALPLFLEGPVHYLRSSTNRDRAAQLATAVRASGLFDIDLKMYKVNESLEHQPMEIGRARTFSPGWFENESIWLHMEYKYMQELLRSGLYTEFFHDFKTVFVPFFDPSVYGRSTLENSSFIVSSANPDPSLHGNGFVARLSGATAEFISIMNMMMMGQNPFRLNPDNILQLCFSPTLPAWMFTTKAQSIPLHLAGKWQDLEFAENTFSFMFLGEIPLSFHNPLRRDTFGSQAPVPAVWTIVMPDGKTLRIEAPYLEGEIVEQIRHRKVRRIDIELK